MRATRGVAASGGRRRVVAAVARRAEGTKSREVLRERRRAVVEETVGCESFFKRWARATQCQRSATL
jgi:hypothetical protein